MRPDKFTNTPEDAAAYERLRGMDEWIDNRPTAAELADDFDDWCWWREQQRPDPWGDGPVHHPTRFDLPMPAEPPF